jgi:fatty acid desaturase
VALTPKELEQIRAAVREEVIRVLRWPLVVLGIIGMTLVLVVGGIGALLVVGVVWLFVGLVVVAVSLQKKMPSLQGRYKG